jgi:hypothetical protein
MKNPYHIDNESAFFDRLKPEFVRRFATFLQTLKPVQLNQEEVDSLAALFYDTLFSKNLKEDKFPNQLEGLFDTLAQQNINLNQILSHAMLLLLESYTRFLGNKVDPNTELTALTRAVKDYMGFLEQKLSRFVHADEQHRQEQQEIEHREIIALLKQSQEKDVVLGLNNTFRGISVSYEARVIALHHDQAAFEVHKYQAAAMALEKSTLITAVFLPKPVYARVASINNTSVNLWNFTYLQRPVIKRERLRLQPDTPTQVIFTTDNQEFSGTLVDISINGMGVLLNHPHPPPIGSLVQVRLKLAVFARTGDREIVLSGKIINQLRDPNGHRLGLLTYPEFEVEDIISKYLAHMQTKILHDLQWRSLIV